MPVATGEVIKAIAVLSDKQDVRVSVKQSAKGAIIAGTCTFMGGILLGPVGFIAGGLAGGVTAYRMTKGELTFSSRNFYREKYVLCRNVPSRF